MTEQPYPELPILLVDDQPSQTAGINLLLMAKGYTNTSIINDSRQVMPWLGKNQASMVILDLSMPHLSGQELLDLIVQDYPDLPVVISTSNTDIDTAVHCIRAKAYDYLLKPIDENRLFVTVERALALLDMQTELASLRHQVKADGLSQPQCFSSIITQNSQMLALMRYTEAVSSSPQPVLITGETGTGKELIARAVHACSNRQGKFVAVNIAGLDETIFADTLFGHVKGSFTGAAGTREGLVERATGGTLFLDEIGDLSTENQLKLLRLLQEREYLPLGSDTPKRTSARIVVASNSDLRARVKQGAFRQDLFYRLNTHLVHLPPLRERLEDLEPLCTYFVRQAATELNKPAPTLPGKLIATLAGYEFSGNHRELKALLYNVVAANQGPTLPLQPFIDYIKQNSEQPPASAQPDEQDSLPTLKQATRQLVERAVKHTDGNQSLAAALLGISRTTLLKYLKEDN